MTNKDKLAEKIKELPPEEVYDILYHIVFRIGYAYNTSRGGVADWLMRETVKDEYIPHWMNEVEE